ncbi:PREDICTED: uncharacterized protein LOC104810483 [Tarenaya hassleriana]|uniref:uncharacterized protein LOC104810483 n=1 Tax=Tarenaya hassleriana TaxID=28532 RepID=UPI00053C3B28|nr:PREDICTED: uncharacterized protein LOC104810483 [Tarenaya hassleriana]
MRSHSAIALRKFLSGNPFRISQNPAISSSTLLLHSLSPRFWSLPTPVSGSQTYLHLNSSSTFGRETRRRYSTDAGGESPPDVNKAVDEINMKFAEAREEIEMAMESKETVYFDEEAECARAAVAEVVEMFERLLRRLPEGQRAAVQRSMGLKIEQLKAELQQLND